jgi:hypothetical protein
LKKTEEETPATSSWSTNLFSQGVADREILSGTFEIVFFHGTASSGSRN